MAKANTVVVTGEVINPSWVRLARKNLNSKGRDDLNILLRLHKGADQANAEGDVDQPTGYVSVIIPNARGHLQLFPGDIITLSGFLYSEDLYPTLETVLRWGRVDKKLIDAVPEKLREVRVHRRITRVKALPEDVYVLDISRRKRPGKSA